MATTLPDQPATHTTGGPVLEVRNLTVEFPTDDGIVHAGSASTSIRGRSWGSSASPARARA